MAQINFGERLPGLDIMIWANCLKAVDIHIYTFWERFCNEYTAETMILPDAYYTVIENDTDIIGLKYVLRRDYSERCKRHICRYRIPMDAKYKLYGDIVIVACKHPGEIYRILKKKHFTRKANNVNVQALMSAYCNGAIYLGDAPDADLPMDKLFIVEELNICNKKERKN